MLTSLFIKKVIYFFTTGTILLAIVSFSSNEVAQQSSLTGENSASQQKSSSYEKAMACQENVKSMNSGRPSTLRKDFSVNMTNFLKLSNLEQKVLNRYLHDFELSFSDGTKPINYELTTYVFESASRRTLGSKVVIHEPGHPEKNVGTYFLSMDGNVLFSHKGGLIPSQKWDCERGEKSAPATQVAASGLTNLMIK